MAVDDRIAARKPRAKTGCATGNRPGNVNHSESRALHLDDALERERLLQRGLVLIPVYGFDRRSPRP
jgi:hypothetical protein